MAGIFKSNNPLGLAIIFVIGIIIRFQTFDNPLPPLQSAYDGGMYTIVVELLKKIGGGSFFIFALLSYLLVFSQAVMLNIFMNNYRMLGKSNYLPSFCYVTVSALFSEWMVFSSALVVSTFMIPIWNNVTNLFKSDRAKHIIFNSGMLIGFASFFHFSAIGFMLMLYLGNLILRPPSLPEWIVGILGLFLPYYFLFSFTYLTGTWNAKANFPALSFRIPGFDWNTWTITSWLMVIIPFLIGAIYLQNSMLKINLHARKGWNMMTIYLFLSILISFLHPAPSIGHFMLAMAPMTAYQTNLFQHAKKSFLPVSFIFLLIGYLLVRLFADVQ